MKTNTPKSGVKNIVNYSDLKGKFLKGIMPGNESDESDDKPRLYFFFKDRVIGFVSDNQDYSWFSNWRIVSNDIKKPELDSTYKVIGETITDVWIDGNLPLETNDINAENTGKWNQEDGEEYTFIKISTPSKVIALTTVFYSCHYPSVLWNVLETWTESSDQLTVHDVQTSVEQLKHTALSKSYIERELWKKVLTEIANGHMNPRELAREALKTEHEAMT